MTAHTVPAERLSGVAGGAVVATGAAALLLLSLLLPYFKLNLPGPGAFGAALAPSKSGLASNPLIGVLLLGEAALVLAVCGSLLAERALPVRLARPAWQLTAGAGAGALAELTVLVVHPPKLLPGPKLLSGAAALIGIEPRPQLGLYLGLLAAAAVCVAGLTLAGGPLASATDAAEAGWLRVGVDHARATGARTALLSLVLGGATPVAAVVGLAADSTVMLTGAFCGAVAAVLTARRARAAARAAGDEQLARLSRVGQRVGWTVLTLVGVAIVLLLVTVGQTAQQVGAL